MTNEQPANIDGTKLIHLEGEVKQTNRAKDINNKINHLESSLGDLQKELEVVNNWVEEGLDRLSDSDLDITAKVSETYKRLGEIDNTYKTLSKISDDIDGEVKKLTVEMETVAEQSAADLERLETASSAQIKKTNEQHEQLVSRVNDLVEHSRETNKELTSSIKKNTDALLALEKQLVNEIESLANATEERDNEIASDLDVAKKAIEKNKARIIQLQSVDEALAKRATAVEIAAAELTDKSRKLESSVNLLDARTSDISTAVINLQEKSEQQASLITGLQKTAEEIALSLLALTNVEKYHFRTLSGALLLVLLLVTTLYFYQQGINEDSNAMVAERTQFVDQAMVSLHQQDTVANSEIEVIQDKLLAINEKIEGDIKEVNSKLLDINDQTDSLNGRLSNVSPFSQFGQDSIIHGPQWFAEQPENNFVIQLSMVSDKNKLYEIAQRYNHYLKDQVAYYAVKTNRGEQYVLTYGSFSNNADISAALYRMPHYISSQRPNVARIADIQKTLSL
jgi:chromosome segregation ATPase